MKIKYVDQMRHATTVIVLWCLFGSCLQKEDSFCSKYSSEKNEIIRKYVDSLTLTQHGDKILKNYILLHNLENDVNTYSTNATYQYSLADTPGGNCQVFLQRLSTVQTDKYLKTDTKGFVTSYVPILTIDNRGKVITSSAIVTYDNGVTDTVANETVTDYAMLIDEKRLSSAKRRKAERLQALENEAIAKRKKAEDDQRRKEQRDLAVAKKHELKRQQEAKSSTKELLKKAIPSESLYRMYKENEIRADRRFGAKEITVKGTVASVTKESGDPVIHLAGDDFLGTVSCETTDAEMASQINSGQLIVIRGTCVGLDILKVKVMLENSEVVAY